MNTTMRALRPLLMSENLTPIKSLIFEKLMKIKPLNIKKKVSKVLPSLYKEVKTIDNH